MRNLIVCCDGTWCDEDSTDDGIVSPSNVLKVFRGVDQSIQNGAPHQLTRYQSGVGTEGIMKKLLGGLVGYGLNEDIEDCYYWLSDKFEVGDKIFLFGFSRGAFTARSLAGLITRYGLLKLPKDDALKSAKAVKELYRNGYRKGNEDVARSYSFHKNSDSIDFLGVWDTVGALGIPDDKSILDLFDNPLSYQFHDVQLSLKVKQARHALALDEERGSFTPTLWVGTANRDNDTVKQVWFPGVHSDIGGGYKEQGLSDCTLKWMVDEARSFPGSTLRFKEGFFQQVNPNSFDMVHDSHVGIMKALIPSPRSVPKLVESERVSPCVLERIENPPIQQSDYRPLKPFIDNEIEIDIYAKHPWSWTGVYLEAGKEYRFQATGVWFDKNIPCPPSGASDDEFHLGEVFHVLGAAFGKVESAWEKVIGNKNADFAGTRRYESSDWFCLMGSIANGSQPSRDGTPDDHETFEIGVNKTKKVDKSGYLYCFANDAWGLYGNNRGYVTLIVSEV